jgi:hypothetical protein
MAVDNFGYSPVLLDKKAAVDFLGIRICVFQYFGVSEVSPQTKLTTSGEPL